MGRDQRNREKLVEAAASLFHLRGFQPTSLDEILERSGVCRSNFYYYFRSKEDLGLEVLGRQAEAFTDRVIRGILEDHGATPRDRLTRLFDAVTEEMRKAAYRGGCPFGNLAAELCGVHPEFRARLSAFFERWEDAVQRCLAEGVGCGQFCCDLDPRAAAIALVSQIEEAVLLAKAHGHGAAIEAGAQAMMKLLESR